MLVRSKKDWELPESAVTAERDYRLRDRRAFLKTLGVAGVAFAARDLFAATAGFPSKENPAYPASALKVTPYEFVTSYNNFYEFGMDKGEPKEYANKGFKAEPWTLEIAGLAAPPASSTSTT